MESTSGDSTSEPTPEPTPEPRVNYDSLANELEILKANIQKRKREITLLKIMLYIGVVIVMVGFFYSSNTLQKAQIENMEQQVQRIETSQYEHLEAIQDDINSQIRQLKAEVAILIDNPAPRDNRYIDNILIENSVTDMEGALSRLETKSSGTKRKIHQVQNDSKVFLEAYRNEPPNLR